jgi:MFS family permease
MASKFTVYGRSILLLSVIMFLSSLATNFFAPVWPIYIKSLGASMTEIGLVFSLSNAVAAMLQIPSGWVSDRYGRRTLHTVGTLLGVFPPLLYTLAMNWFDLIPWVMLSGVSLGLYLPIRWSIVADVSTVQTYAKAYSWTNVAWLVGPTVSPLLGGLVADLYGIRVPFLVCFALMCLSFPLSLLLRETRRKGSPSITHKTADDEPKAMSFLSVILLFSLINIIQGIGIEMLFPITPVFVKERFPVDHTFVGLLFAVGFGLASIMVQVPGGKWASGYSRKKIMLITTVLSSPFYALFALSQNLVELFIFMFLSQAVLNISWPASQALLMELTPSAKWGLVNGISATTWWIGMMIGAVTSGVLWDAFGMFVPYYVSALFVFLSVVPVLFLREPSRSA